MQEYLYRLQKQIVAYFEMNELQDLAFALGLDWEEIIGSTKTDKTRQILIHIHNRNRLPDLLAQLRLERDKLDWPDPPPNSVSTFHQPLVRDFSLPNPRMNRDVEIQCIERILTNQDPKTCLITLIGPSGSGKTWLIKEYTKLCQQHNQKLLPIDLKSEAAITADQCLQKIVLALGIGYFTHYNNFRLQGKPEPLSEAKEKEWQNNLTTTFFQDLHQQPHLPRLFLLFDHFESKRSDEFFHGWLKNTFLPGLFSQQALKLIIAGQDELQYTRHQQHHQPFPLKPIPIEYYSQFATACNVDIEPHDLNLLHQISQGRPELFVQHVHNLIRGA